MYQCQYESVSFGQFKVILDRKYALLVIRLQPDKNTERLYQGSIKNLNSSLPMGQVAL